MFEFKLPDLGEGIHEGELILWHVKVGDIVAEDDPLCDLETDKAMVTIPSPRSGTIAFLNGKPGDILKVESVFVVIDEKGSNDKIEIETKSFGLQDAPLPPEPSASKKIKRPGKRAIAAPATRRLAREMGIDINQVSGSGPGGKVIREDVINFKDNNITIPEADITDEKILNNDSPGSSTGMSIIPFLEIASLPDFEVHGPVEKLPIRSIRKKTAVKTTSSMILIPHVAHMDEFDVTELEAFRKKINQENQVKQEVVKLTLLPFVIKALAAVLPEYRPFNASIDPEKAQIIYKLFLNIGFAADTPKGLMVPVIKDAGKKSIIELAQSIRNLAQKGRKGTITLPEISNGTFTVTNVGAIGGTRMVPTINYPESAILGMGRVIKKPVVRDDNIVIRKILPVTLCFDHRVADGAQAARFVNQLKLMLEDPLVFMTRI